MKFNFILLLLLLTALNIMTAEDAKHEKVQRTPYGITDIQSNTISNMNFINMNNGIIFIDRLNDRGSCVWPRGSSNQYMYGGGLWFACQKKVYRDSIIEKGDGTYDTLAIPVINKLCSMSYDPNAGVSWMVPGRIDDGNSVDSLDMWKYRVYFSTGFDANGKPKISLEKYYWPLWNDPSNNAMSLGTYVADVEKRNIENYPNGPFYKSDEDIFTVFKDTDLKAYKDTFNIRKAQGYPLGLQYEQTILSWKSDDYKDMIIIFYKVTNKSQDTLLNCWVAPIYDMDLALITNPSAGAANDRAKFYTNDRSLNLGIAWTLSNQGEYGRGFGYLGISFIMTPAVDGNNRLMHPADYYERDNQIGLITFRNWSIEEDLKDDAQRYEFVSSGTIDEAMIPGDRRLSFSSGPFDFYPGESVYLATQFNIANSLSQWEAVGDDEDMQLLIDKVKKGQKFFYDEVMEKIDDFSDKSLNFEIYPNPAKGKFIVRHNFPNEINISIYDVLGTQILSERLSPSAHSVLEFDLQGLPAGNYIICISDNKTLISKKLILTK